MNKPNIDMVTQGLQKINYKALLDKIKPIIFLYENGEPRRKNQLKKYELEHNFHPPLITEISSPMIISKTLSEEEKAQILKKQFGENVLYFVETILDKNPDANLSLLYENLPTLDIFLKNYNFSNMVLRASNCGDYNTKTNIARVTQNKNLFSQSFYHELFHVSSTLYDKQEDISYSGFCRFYPDGITGIGINEGYTEIMTERYFANETELFQPTFYIYEKFFASKLEEIVGKEKMEQLYFETDLEGLIEELKQCASEDDIKSFLINTDVLTHVIYNDSVSFKLLDKIISRVEQTLDFLVESYIKMQYKKLSEGLITNQELEDNILSYEDGLNNTYNIRGEEYLYNNFAEINYRLSEEVHKAPRR